MVPGQLRDLPQVTHVSLWTYMSGFEEWTVVLIIKIGNQGIYYFRTGTYLNLLSISEWVTKSNSKKNNINDNNNSNSDDK